MKPGIRESLSGVLEDEGLVCAAAASGEECLEELARNSYDAIPPGRMAPPEWTAWRRWRASKKSPSRTAPR